MMRLRILSVALMLALIFACPVQANDSASAKLTKAVELYNDGAFEQSRSVLRSIDSGALTTEDEQLQLQHYLSLTARAIEAMTKAQGTFNEGMAALNAGRLTEARQKFQSVLGNDFASAALKAQANQQLQIVSKRASGAIQSNRPPRTMTSGSTGTMTSSPGTSSSSGSRDVVVMTPSGSTRSSTPINTDYISSSTSSSSTSSSGTIHAIPMSSNTGQSSSLAPSTPTSNAINQSSLVDKLSHEHSLLWQKAEATYKDANKKIRMAILNADFEEARRLMDYAKETIELNRRYASPASRYTDLLAQANDLEAFIEDEEAQHDEDILIRQQQEIADAEADRVANIQSTKERQVSQLMEKATELRKEQRLEEAVQVLGQILAIDPTREEATWQKETLEDLIQNMRDRAVVREHDREAQSLYIEINEARTPIHRDITYPKNWPELSAKRTSAEELQESEETRRVRQKLQKAAPEIRFDALTFERVIEKLRALTGLNIVPNWAAMEASAIERDVEVTLKLQNVKFQKALELILDEVGAGEVELAYEIDDGVISISTKEDLSRRTKTTVYNIQDLLISVPTFRGRRINLQQIGQNNGQVGGLGGGRFLNGGGAGGGGGGGGQGGGLFEGDEGGDEEEDLTDPLEPIIDLIQETIEPDSWREAGGNVGSISSLQQQLIVTQTSTAHSQLRDLLRQLRQARALQIAIEARYITIARNWVEQIGVDLDVVLNNGNAGFDRTTILDPATNNPVLVPREFVRNGFTPGAPGGVGITLPTQPFGQPFGQPGLVPAAGNGGPHSGRMTPIPLVNSTLDLASPANTNIAGSLGGLANTTPAFQVFGSFLDNIQVDFLLRATQIDQRLSSLDAPRLVLFNGQRATFEAFIEQDYIAALTPVIGDNAGAFTPIVDTALTGRSLDVQATVSADRRYVTMTVRTFTRVTGDFRTVFFGGSQTVGSGFIELATQTTQQIRTTVSVPDGGTLLIGGLKLSGERDVDAGVPILSRIPILKRAFSNTSNVKDDQVLLILIKPTIIIQEEAEAEAFPTLG